MQGLDDCTGVPDGIDGVLITGASASTRACFVREISGEGFATVTEETLSTREGWLAPSGVEGARGAFCSWEEFWFVLSLIT